MSKEEKERKIEALAEELEKEIPIASLVLYVLAGALLTDEEDSFLGAVTAWEVEARNRQIKKLTERR